MSRVCYLVFFIISHLLHLALAREDKNSSSRCSSFNCGNLGYIGFPFFDETHRACGILKVEGCKEHVQRIQLGKQWFYVTNISKDNTLALQDQSGFGKPLDNRSCVEYLRKFSIPSHPSISFKLLPSNQTRFRCPGTPYSVPENYNSLCSDSKHSIICYNGSNRSGPPSPPRSCSLIQFQLKETQKGVDFFNLYTGSFRIQVNVTRECYDCYIREGTCSIDRNGSFNCTNATVGSDRTRDSAGLKIGRALGIGIGVLTVVIVILLIWHFRCNTNHKYTAGSFLSRYTSSDPSSNPELEVGSVNFSVPIFSYSELAEATNNFNQKNELGDGGFGTVYYAKLRDGREVAVKRLYKHNYRRLEQFMNEIEILAHLRHSNLVSLYGCTSRYSQDLLLVYEFIANGTVADHLHGDRAKPGSITWPIRLNIAIESASALAYLHASDIIHRDVKTHNILLDNNFCVKVADFGLSRLFPTDVTHVSTAPQGSPGYVDPEYHRCYQLTDKSDVYSFGVVLIELISSMPAVDMNRHRDEINLANLAINRIQNSAIDELIDPYLGYQSDEEVKRMTSSVAELAFLCLQQNKEMRPSMDVVLEELKRIKSGELNPANPTEKHDDNEVLKSAQPTCSSPDCDEASLLKNIQLSPRSVTAKWISSDTTSFASS